MEFTFCPRCGTRLEPRPSGGVTRPHCPHCGYTQYRNPLPVAGCLVEHAGSVVLVRRGGETGRGKWALPTGFVEWGEAAEAAAARETREETGLAVRIASLLGVYSYAEPRESGLIVLYVAASTGGTLRGGDDAQEARVFPAGQWPDDLAFPTHRRALADYLARRENVPH